MRMRSFQRVEDGAVAEITPVLQQPMRTDAAAMIAHLRMSASLWRRCPAKKHIGRHTLGRASVMANAGSTTTRSRAATRGPSPNGAPRDPARVLEHATICRGRPIG